MGFAFRATLGTVLLALTLASDSGAQDAGEDGFENSDVMAPWNDPLLQDDFMAPWNDPLLQDDFMAPWNDPIAGPDDTNEYLRENDVRDGEYYWDE